MATSKHLEDLPTEILGNIFSNVHDPGTIRNARLVSRRIKDIASAFLIRKIHVRMTSESLADLEELCDHDIYSKSIRKVTIVTSYYDVVMSNDISLFAQHCESSLYQHLEILERSRSYRNSYLDKDEQAAAEHKERIQRLWDIISKNEITEVGGENFSEQNVTPVQKLIQRCHRMYKQRCDDQQSIRRDNEHITRICAALQKLPALERLAVEDMPPRGRRRETLSDADFPDLGFKRPFLNHFDWILYPSNWCGSFTTAYVTQPPTEMLGELCSRLGRCGIRPRSIGIVLNAPADLGCLRLSADQNGGVRNLVARATKLNLRVDGWARKGSHAENNDRNREEMLSLCSFTQPFFDAPFLKCLKIHFVEFPSFHQTPTVGLADILPFSKTRPQLSTVHLRYLPITIVELRAFVELQKDSVKEFVWYCGWLLQGGWDEAVDALRGLRLIVNINLKYPRGERYGSGRGVSSDIPYDHIYDYISRRTDVNPLTPRLTE